MPNPLVFDILARDKFSKTLGGFQKGLLSVSKLAAGAALTGVTAFATLGANAFLEFDDQLNQSLAIMGEVSGPMTAKMEAAARAVGKTTRFSASEAAEAYFFLASAGMSAQQSIKAMPQVAAFATAGMFDLSRATDLATDAQSALGLAVDDPKKNLQNLTRVTDVLVKANTLANASVEQFSTSLTRKAGVSLRQFDKDMEEGVAALAVFADQGIKGELAGTMLSTTLDGLAKRAIANKEEFEELGIRVFDSNGKMLNLSNVVGSLESALGSLSAEQQIAILTQLGFNKQSLDGIRALIGNSDALAGYEKELRKAGGTTKEVADKQLSSFAARLDLMKSAAVDASMSVGETLVNALFDTIAVGKEAVAIFTDLPPVLQGVTLGLAGIVASAPLLVAGWGKLRDAISGVTKSFQAMGTAGKVATLSLGAIGVALAAGAVILGGYAKANADAQSRVDALADSLREQTGAVTDSTRELVADELVKSGAADAAERLGIELETLGRAYLGEKDALAEVEETMVKYRDEKTQNVGLTNSMTTSLTEEGQAERDLNEILARGSEELARAQKEWRQRNELSGQAKEKADDQAEAEEGLAEATSVANGFLTDQVDALKELVDELTEAADVVLGMRDAERDYEAALDDINASLEENGKKLDISTEKGRENQAALDGLAQAGFRRIAAAEKEGATEAEIHDLRVQSAKDLFEQARKLGMSEKAANKYVESLHGIPIKTVTELEAKRDKADREIRRLKASLKGVKDKKTIAKIDANIKGAQERRKRIQREINSLTGKTVHVGVTVSTGALESLRSKILRMRGGIVELAQGTLSAPSGVALVGEKGPELVRMRGGERVFNAAQTASMARQVGAGELRGQAMPGQVRPEPVQRVELDGAAGRLLTDILRREIRHRGGNVQIVLGAG